MSVVRGFCEGVYHVSNNLLQTGTVHGWILKGRPALLYGAARFVLVKATI